MRENRSSLYRAALLVILAVFTAGCQSVAFYRSDTLGIGTGTRHVMLMPADVELSLIKLGGTLEPKADWTTKAREFLEISMRIRNKSIFRTGIQRVLACGLAHPALRRSIARPVSFGVAGGAMSELKLATTPTQFNTV